MDFSNFVLIGFSLVIDYILIGIEGIEGFFMFFLHVLSCFSEFLVGKHISFISYPSI